MSLNLVTTPLWPLPAIEPSEAGAFRQQAKRLLLNAFADLTPSLGLLAMKQSKAHPMHWRVRLPTCLRS